MDKTSQSEAADAAVSGDSPAVREQLKRLCRSAEFADSPRADEFLRYVVEETLAGQGGGLSQRSIARGVYGRDGDFDPAIDPLVRMQAQRVRRSLEHYYLTEGRQDPIEVRLPKGGYQPEFKVNGHGERAPARQDDGTPVLMMAPFQNDTGSEEFEFIAQGLASDLAVALDCYQAAQILLLRVSPGENEPAMEKARRACGGARCFLVKGRVSYRSGALRVAVRLEDVSTGLLRWSHEKSCEDDGEKRDRFLDELVKRVAACIAEEQGALVQQTFDRIKGTPPLESSSYGALLHLYHAERSGSLEHFETAVMALRHGVEVAPEDGRLWGGLARLCTLNHILEFLPNLQVPMDDVIEYAEKGAFLREEDQRAWCILAYAQTMAGHLGSGHESTLTALALNPESLFFRDVIGYLLILQGDYERGAALSKEAVKLNPFVRGAVFAGLWLEAFRREDFEEAHAWAERHLELQIFWVPAMRAAALARLGRHSETQAALKHLFLVRPDFRESGPRLIRKGIKIEEVGAQVEEALRDAGVEFTSAG